MAGEHFADFAQLWLVCHQSRVEAAKPNECWLEKWFLHARDEGIRALHRLRGGVQRTIELLGSGFLKHRANAPLRESLQSGNLDVQDFYRELLRLAYRLIFLFVAEDRGLLLDPAAPEAARERYTRYYATARLRRLAERRRGGPHGDLWQGLRLVLGKLYAGCPELGLPALGSFLWSTRATPHLDRAELANEDLLAAFHALARVDDERGVSYSVSWQSLAADELGSVYEALLELHPRLHTETGLFELATAAGNERKTSGSYYTPEELVERLLDSALTPVLSSATLGKPRDIGIAALLDLKVCDPACGSGHFLVAAARRLARRLASLRTGDDEPAPSAMQAALREVVGRCLFGVDINPMAVELCKVSLWMEALEPGKPLSFLESHIQCGNALLGATPALLARGIPEDAFATLLEGDDREATKTLRKRDRDDRKGLRATLELFAAQSPATAPTNADASLLRIRAEQVDRAADGSLPAVEAKESEFTTWQSSPEQRRAEFLADLWCASLVWPKSPQLIDVAPTTSEWLHLLRKPDDAKPVTLQTVAEAKKQYKFFHWHLRFPQVFAPATAKTEPNDSCGWIGGFDVILGNPPWDHVELKDIEFFSIHRPAIANAGTAAERKQMIQELRESDPELYKKFCDAERAVGGQDHTLRESGRFPLCGSGRLNTFALFAELNRSLLHTRGWAGFITPTGLITDATTGKYTEAIISNQQLASAVSFENFGTKFGDVNNRQSFCLITLSATPVAEMRLRFNVNQALPPNSGPIDFTLTADEVKLLNPLTLTCPTFRTRRDAALVTTIYKEVPSLCGRTENPWEVVFAQGLLNMATDSKVFRTSVQLVEEGWQTDSTFYTLDRHKMLPLYEAKMIQHFDHRFASLIQGPPGDRPSRKFEGWYGVRPQDPEEFVVPRYWVDEDVVTAAVRSLPTPWRFGWFIGFRDISRSTDSRTVIASAIPYTAVGHTLPLLLPHERFVSIAGCLLVCLSTFVLDYVARQKLGGTHLTFGFLSQLPVLPPERFDHVAPWNSETSTAGWIRAYVLELAYTAWDLDHFARDLGHEGPPFRSDPFRRFILRAELDAAFFHLYNIERDAVEWIMDTFPVIRQKDEKTHGEYRTKRVILERYDAMAQAIATGRPYQTILDPPPAHPSLTHPPRPPGAPAWPLPPAPREVVVDFTAAPEELIPPAAPVKPEKPRKQRSAAAKPNKSASTNADDFRLTSPPHTPQLGLALAVASPDPPSPSATEFQLTAPVPQLGLGFASTTPQPAPPVAVQASASTAPPQPSSAPASAPTDDDPPRIRALRDAGGKLARPEVLAVLRALHRATDPLSKDQLLVATGIDDKAWPALIKFLLEADLVAAQGKGRGTRYTLC
nr:N-6 DNA methylase [Nannocystis sp. ILAH1]